jgi:hypothetical protein
MGRQEQVLASFNRGRVSSLGIARLDVKRIAMAAETQTNYIPRVLGSMSMRPGFKYLGSTKSNAACRLVPFVYTTSDTSLLEFTDSFIRFWKDDALITRVATVSTVPAISGWTDSDESGGTSTYSAPYLTFVGTGTNAAIRDTSVTTATPNVQHALRIVVERGPIVLRVGTAIGDDSYINEVTLKTGTHSLTFTPTGTFWIRFLSRQIPIVRLASCDIESAGVMSLPSPYTASDLSLIRTDASADVIFVACEGYQQRIIERRSNNSWSIVLYQPNDGPFKTINITPTTLTGSATTGNITVTASASFFKSTDVGGLFKLVTAGQSQSKAIAAQNTFSNSIVVTGISRSIGIEITGTLAASTVRLQRSTDDSTWSDVAAQSWTAVTTTSYDDTLNNQTIYYRIGIKTGEYGGADSIVATLTFSAGSQIGIVRATGYTSETVIDAEVLSPLGTTTSTDTWYAGAWSSRYGWPSAVSLHEGRLWWGGLSKVWGSISDAYDSYDSEVTGDSGVISRTIGSGPVTHLNWMASNQRLLIGSDISEFSARASSLDEPLTPTAFVIRPTSNQGSASTEPIKIDNRCLFVQRSGIRVYELAFDTRFYDYSAKDITTIIPEIGSPSIIRMAAQRQPDTRIHCIRSDGTVALNVQDKNEDMTAWIDIETDGLIEDVAILPAVLGDSDDYVYYAVKRTINGSTVRYIEKMAQTSEALPGTATMLADAYIDITQTANVLVTGLSHLEGEQVAVWADGNDVGTNTDYSYIYTVSGGSITLATAATRIVVGLPYTAQFKSMKIGSPANDVAQTLNHYKNVNHLGLVMAYTHTKGVRYGPEFTFMDSLPDIEYSIPVGQQTYTYYTSYEEQSIEFPGTWENDSRICLQSQSPRPCTLLAIDFQMEVT